MQLENKTIFITGGTSGIGLALAKLFLKLKCTVIVCGRDENKINSIKNNYRELKVFQCDISKKNEVVNILKEIEVKYKGFDILINNAGIQYNYNFLENNETILLSEEEIGINFTSQIIVTKLALPILINRPESAIINVSSALSIVPKKSAPIYCATKAAIHIFTKSLRYQLENTKIRIFEVIPSLVDTEMTKDRDKKKTSPELVAKKVIKGLKKNKNEIRIGKVRLLFFIHRLFPSKADKILKND